MHIPWTLRCKHEFRIRLRYHHFLLIVQSYKYFSVFICKYIPCASVHIIPFTTIQWQFLIFIDTFGVLLLVIPIVCFHNEVIIETSSLLKILRLFHPQKSTSFIKPLTIHHRGLRKIICCLFSQYMLCVPPLR